MQKFLLTFMALIAFLVSYSYSQVPQKISYQGLLTTSSGAPVVAGSYDLKFEIFNLPSGGTLRHTETQSAVPVQRGAFSVILGTASAFTLAFNESLYVEVTALAGPGISSPLTFSPRSELTSAPYALKSLSLLGPGSIATGVGSIAGGSNNRARGDYSFIGGGGGEFDVDSNSAVGEHTTIGGGRVNKALGLGNTIGGGVGNTANGNNSTVVGGSDNSASANATMIGGGVLNKATSAYATVGGGYWNVASNSGAVIAGGENDSASGALSTVSGGIFNTASNQYATVGGGKSNTASGYSSTVGGGTTNTASNQYATVGGGLINTASGSLATVPGGQENTAAGSYSFAAGWHAKANHGGAFVWADSQNTDFASTGVNQFLIRASGGVGIGTNSPDPAPDPFRAPVVTVGPSGTNKASVLELQGNTAGNWAVGALAFRNTAMGVPENRLAEIQAYSDGASDAGSLMFLTKTGSGSLYYRMWIKPNGNVGIGTTTPGYKLEVAGDINAIGSVRSNGIALTSDVRFKKNISTLSHALDDLKGLRGVSYYWKKDEFPAKQFSEERQIGFIAQELEKIFPELVSTGADGYKGVDYARLTPVLVEAIKEQQKEIDELKAMVKSLALEKNHGGEKSIGELK